MHRAGALLIFAALAGCSSPTASDPPQAPATPSEAAATPTADDAVASAWAATAAEHRGNDGEQFTYACPGGGEPRSVWGTDTYTDDSSVCSAAVHAGAISVDVGGRVIIEIRPGEDEYESSERNGIESFPYDAWGGSFVVVGE